MNYRINLYETFDDNGITSINLFLEVRGQIYNSTHYFVDEKYRNDTIGLCFAEISKLIGNEVK